MQLKGLVIGVTGGQTVKQLGSVADRCKYLLRIHLTFNVCEYSGNASAEKSDGGLFSAGHGAGSPLWWRDRHGGHRAIWRDGGKYAAAGTSRAPRAESAVASRSNRSAAAGSLSPHPASARPPPCSGTGGPGRRAQSQGGRTSAATLWS